MMLSGHFVDAEPGRIFVTAWQSELTPEVAVICVPPALEELNASRRQLAVQAQRLAGEGLDTFIMDYFASGDSEGQDFEASYENWQQSLVAAMDWVLSLGYKSIVLWGVRVGCFVIAECLRQKQRPEVTGILFWQPLESGKQWTSALQRLQLLAGKQNSNDQQIEVAGYHLSETLLQPMDNFEWTSYETCLGYYPLEIILISTHAAVYDRVTQTFASARSVSQVEGGPFWSIPESPVNQSLKAQTLIQLQAMAGVIKAGQGD